MAESLTPFQDPSSSEKISGDVLLYQYPANTAGADSTNGTYYHKMNENTIDAVNEVKKWISDNSIDMKQLGRYTLHDELTILRYLRANNMSPEKAIAHMEKNIEYRKEMNVDELMTMNPEAM
jgi:hypothetical protein